MRRGSFAALRGFAATPAQDDKPLALNAVSSLSGRFSTSFARDNRADAPSTQRFSCFGGETFREGRRVRGDQPRTTPLGTRAVTRNRQNDRQPAIRVEVTRERRDLLLKLLDRLPVAVHPRK